MAAGAAYAQESKPRIRAWCSALVVRGGHNCETITKHATRLGTETSRVWPSTACSQPWTRALIRHEPSCVSCPPKPRVVGEVVACRGPAVHRACGRARRGWHCTRHPAPAVRLGADPGTACADRPRSHRPCDDHPSWSVPSAPHPTTPPHSKTADEPPRPGTHQVGSPSVVRFCAAAMQT